MTRHDREHHNGSQHDQHAQFGFPRDDVTLEEIAESPITYKPYADLHRWMHGRMKTNRRFPEEGLDGVKIAFIGGQFEHSYFSLRPVDKDGRDFWGRSGCMFWGESAADINPETLGAIQFGHTLTNNRGGEHVAVLTVREIREAGADIAWVPSGRNVLHCVVFNPHSPRGDLDSRVCDKLSSLARQSAGLEVTALGDAFARAAAGSHRNGAAKRKH